VSFIPTAGRSGCTPNESFEEIILSLESDTKAPWKLFAQMVESSTLLETLRRGQEKYSGSTAKALVRQYGCDQSSALRLEFSMLGLSRYQFVREFCLVDLSPLASSDEDKSSSMVMVYYVPELESSSVTLSYEDAVKTILGNPEDDTR
jgi:hypothetical protein